MRSSDWELCPVCFWEDDPQQRLHPDLANGANGYSLVEAQEHYATIGASHPAFLDRVRPARDDEAVDEGWRRDTVSARRGPPPKHVTPETVTQRRSRVTRSLGLWALLDQDSANVVGLWLGALIGVVVLANGLVRVDWLAIVGGFCMSAVALTLLLLAWHVNRRRGLTKPKRDTNPDGGQS